MSAYSLFFDPLAKYDINYLSKKYAKQKTVKLRKPTEFEGRKYLRDRWKKIYEKNKEMIKRDTYFSMKGHIRRFQYDMFFRYLKNLSMKNTLLFGEESSFYRYMERESIPDVPPVEKENPYRGISNISKGLYLKY